MQPLTPAIAVVLHVVRKTRRQWNWQPATTSVKFSDEVFVDLEGERAAGMWRMLCERGKDLKIEFSDIEADDSTGRAHWEAWYTFSSTRRPVHNRIDARFEFKDGKIIRHRDSFDFWAWARQALGPIGVLLGWSGFLRNRVRRKRRESQCVLTQRARLTVKPPLLRSSQALRNPDETREMAKGRAR